MILILGLTGWTGIYRLVRAEYIKHRTREYVSAAQAIGASHLSRMFVPHPAEREPRGAGAALAARRRLHQGRSDPLVPRPRRAGRHGVLGHDAGRGAERAGASASGGSSPRRRFHGGLRDRVLAAHRRAARRAGSETADDRSTHRCADPEPRRRASAIDRTRPSRSGKRSPKRSAASASTFRRTRPSRWSASRVSGKSVSRDVDPADCCPKTRSLRPRAASSYGGRNLLTEPIEHELRDDPRQGHLGGLPGADDVAEPGVHRSASRSPRRCDCTWALSRRQVARSRRGAAERSRHSRAAVARRFVSARAVGRPAAARDDRDGDRLRAQAADRRRAHHRARRHRAAPDPRPDRAPAGAATA